MDISISPISIFHRGIFRKNAEKMRKNAEKCGKMRKNAENAEKCGKMRKNADHNFRLHTRRGVGARPSTRPIFCSVEHPRKLAGARPSNTIRQRNGARSSTRSFTRPLDGARSSTLARSSDDRSSTITRSSDARSSTLNQIF